MRSVLQALAVGDIKPGEAKAVSGPLAAQPRGVELTSFESRLERLEKETRR